MPHVCTVNPTSLLFKDSVAKTFADTRSVAIMRLRRLALKNPAPQKASYDSPRQISLSSELLLETVS